MDHLTVVATTIATVIHTATTEAEEQLGLASFELSDIQVTRHIMVPMLFQRHAGLSSAYLSRLKILNTSKAIVRVDH